MRTERRAERISRRTWMARSLGAVAAGAVAATGSAIANGMEPLGRPAPKFKLSLAAYSYRALLQGQPPALSLYDFIDDCARFGLEGTELTSYYFDPKVTDDELRKIRRHCFRLGLDVSGTAIGNDFGVADPQKLAEQVQLTKTWIDRAAILGAPVIRIFAGHHPEGVDVAASQRQMIATIEECCDYAGAHGIHLALENHGGPTSTAEGLMQFVAAVRSPWFGVNLDSGNFHSADVYGELARIAPYAINVQLKVMVSDAQGQSTPTDWRRLVDILKRANYRGYLALEFEEMGDPRVECERYVDVVRQSLRE